MLLIHRSRLTLQRGVWVLDLGLHELMAAVLIVYKLAPSGICVLLIVTLNVHIKLINLLPHPMHAKKFTCGNSETSPHASL